MLSRQMTAIDRAIGALSRVQDDLGRVERELEQAKIAHPSEREVPINDTLDVLLAAVREADDWSAKALDAAARASTVEAEARGRTRQPAPRPSYLRPLPPEGEAE